MSSMICLILLAFISLLQEKAASQLTKYSSLIQYDREELAELSNMNATMMKEKKRPLEFDLELMIMAQEEAEKIAKSGTIKIPNFSKLTNKYKGYVYRIQGFTEQSYVGSVICVDSFTKPVDSQAYDVNTGCPTDHISQIMQFKNVGYGRAFDTHRNLYAVRIYSNQNDEIPVVTTTSTTTTKKIKASSKKPEITKMTVRQYEAEEIADINLMDKERIARGLKSLNVDSDLNLVCNKLARKLARKNTLNWPKFRKIIKVENFEMYTYKVLGYTKDAYVGSKMCFNSVSSTIDPRIYDMNEPCKPSGISEDDYTTVSYGMDIDEENNVYGVRLFTW